MEQTLSIGFSPERIYLALLEKTQIGLKLNNLATTSSTLDIENLDNPINNDCLEEFFEIVKGFQNANSITVSIPMEYVILTQFPGRPNITNDEIMSVINMEIRQNYPQFNPEEFPTFLFELVPRKNHSYFLAAIIPKIIFQNLKTISNRLNKIVERIEINQISSHNAFLYNYPEEKSNLAALCNISDKFIDFSVIKGSDFFFYNLIKYNTFDEIPELIDKTVSKVNSEFQIQINSIYLFGTHCNKPTLDLLVNKYGKKYNSIKRLNPFRMVTSELEAIDKQICSRIAHHFAPCVGAVLPEIHKRIKIY
ncbi:MAG: hypothetical protein CH6_2055 [Candidatus Kapaibacterium sp.]|jgi:hypothetical protein|nr:MAG: hypothetical protein CH6_2055 [Candidatus Kapabacteria bacterium]ROL57347.1 MAG: hypothetical protein D9V84_04985 [Bacteroidetes/Chlorobi group bacterium Naka2016]